MNGANYQRQSYQKQPYQTQPGSPSPRPESGGTQDRKEGNKTANLICIIISAFTIIMLILGLLLKNPYFLIAGIVPAGIYEAWRTEGYYTKGASIAIVGLVILEILAILEIIKINLAQVLEQDQAYYGGYIFPLGDIKFVFPIVAVILSILLIYRTYGKYTKWLAVLLLITSVALLYLVNKGALLELIRHYI